MMPPAIVSRCLGLVFVALAASLAAPPPAFARVAPTKLETITQAADAIAVARVDSVRLYGGMKVALATVTRPLKGLKSRQRFCFLAERSWSCDRSTAIRGETVLLFLTRPGPRYTAWVAKAHPGIARGRPRLPNIPFYTIAHSGNGRVPVTMRGRAESLKGRVRESWGPKREYLVWLNFITLPAGFPSPSPTSEEEVLPPRLRTDPIVWVPLADVERQIRTYLSPPSGAPKRPAAQ